MRVYCLLGVGSCRDIWFFLGSRVLRLGRGPVVAGGGDVEPDATGDAGASGAFV